MYSASFVWPQYLAVHACHYYFVGFGILYLMFLTFILFQSYKDVREMMFYFDPSLKGQGPDTEVGTSFLLQS